MALTWQTPIYDRTQSDVDRVLELREIDFDDMTADQQAEWLGDMKGALNRSDLERIENNIQIISDKLKLNLDTYAGNVPEAITVTYFAKLVANVEAVRNGYLITSTPKTPKVPINSYKKVNSIEQIINDVYTIYDAVCIYAGDGYCAGDSINLI